MGGKTHLLRFGRPVAFYAYRQDSAASNGVTQFGRALSTLNIEIMCANSSLAKGRVELAHLTLQDRFVKELRLPHVQS